MPINPSLLVAAPMLQDFLISKTGVPLSAGCIVCYHDNSRTTLKNWYYQSGVPGNYTYIPLPNPLTLSAAGTICDVNGFDTIPFFYPYDEQDQTINDPYFIQVFNSPQMLPEQFEFSRENFPPKSGSSIAPTSIGILRNLIINNGFWRNILPNYVNTASPLGLQLSLGGTSNFLTPTSVNIGSLTNLYTGAVAPSQHEVFAFPDIQYMKNNLSANEVCTFLAFPFSNSLVIAGSSSPEYYINHQSTSQGSGESFKGYVFPVALHINNLANLDFTVSIQARSNSAAASTIQLYLLQHLGTAAATPAPILIANTSLTLTSTWANYSLTDIFPSSAGLNVSQTEDDAFYLVVMMPINQVCNIDFTKPALYLTAGAVPTIDFQSYDVVNSIICSFRTGDLRSAVNVYGVPLLNGTMLQGAFGWVYANDGTIGSAASGATSRAHADTWPLYANLWNHVDNLWSPVIGGRGASAYADFIANKQLSLTKVLSRVLGSVGPGAGLTNWSLGQTAGVESVATTLNIGNMPAHNHPGSSVALGIGNQGGSPAGFVTAVTLGPTGLSIAPQGNGQPFNTPVIQPSSFCNYYFKL